MNSLKLTWSWFGAHHLNVSRKMYQLERISVREWPQGQGLWLTHLHIPGAHPISCTRETMSSEFVSVKGIKVHSQRSAIPWERLLCRESRASGINMSQNWEQTNDSHRERTGWGDRGPDMYNPEIKAALHHASYRPHCPSLVPVLGTASLWEFLAEDSNSIKITRQSPIYPEWLDYGMWRLLTTQWVLNSAWFCSLWRTRMITDERVKRSLVLLSSVSSLLKYGISCF